MHRDRIRLSRRHQAWFYTTFAVLFVSGVLWLAYHRYFRIHNEFGDTPHPLEPWWLKLHGAAAMLMLLLLGSLIPNHMRRGWLLRKNRGTGTAIVTANVILIVSGYALYYFGGEQSRWIISAVHWGVGLALPLVLLWHIRKGIARRSPPSSATPNHTSATTSTLE